ncbi:hypothetical protein [Streptomyces sp. FIT100]|uniref:hypothetical protein n=1 Tax=Streptomyces sp. FIT100 TaxID=2837956 RepID=UPI0021CA66B8|nr:hypothetical protein [Streptomyces sp. FIT100]UUN30870.1 hypothetical protein KK483_34445 [Streptomyces sp. FIT100]
MDDLLTRVIRAHGGSARWKELSEVRAAIVSGGDLFAVKGVPQDSAPREMTVRLHEERASVQPFGAPDQRTDFTPGRVSIEKLDGRVVAQRTDPRASFAGHRLETPWDPLDRAYFNGYALWTYLTTPFLLAMPGVTVIETEPWQEGDEVWRGLRAAFPPGIATHCTHQDFYFGPDHLLRRHDYRVDIAGGFAAAQYVHDYMDADGILLPTKRRAHRRDTDGRPIADEVMVAIDLSNVRFS